MSSLRSPIAPFFWRNPIRYCRWAAHERPAIFYSILLGLAGPVMLVLNHPVKKYMGWPLKRPDVPLTYPIPTTPRKKLEGYEDP